MRPVPAPDPRLLLAETQHRTDREKPIASPSFAATRPAMLPQKALAVGLYVRSVLVSKFLYGGRVLAPFPKPLVPFENLGGPF